MRQQESVPVPRGWTSGAAWKGAGASLLLHLFVGAAVIVVLSGPPKAPTQVVDLTLLPPIDIGRRPVPPAFAAAEPPGMPVLAEPPALPASPAVANPPTVTAPTYRSDTAAGIAPVAETGPPRHAAVFPPSSPAGIASGSPHGDAATYRDATGEGGGKATAGNPSGKTGAGYLAGNFAYIRDAVQRGIAYPPAARRMGWEGKVVVAFRLLSDGSVRDVRVLQGSGHIALDRGAIDAVRNASPFPRSPVEAEIITPVVYRLTTR
jgi:protein TonB